ncbi:two-component system response regulator NreC [Pullulanibacillus pueri]|uniref:DNA-binding response regulator n=1 Tax=Pullulanibacillus pueri TaxID=1437324 RepID=A0A8J2ZSX3_9BACL|nr:response regulator transcription factor [Pullulanibacillus pueri]MBM7680320.1 two-component system response regulator NreC [Pullulanibacillus pueri]GGH75674.1 DNA-binding response regulator [Pullulanibacillus pueri]
MNETIRIIVVDDHAIVRSGVKLLLKKEAAIEVIGEAGDGDEAITKTMALQPDVVIMDLTMPGGKDGLEATLEIKKMRPEVKVLILTMHDEPEYLFRVLKIGASGYILKNALDTELISAVRAVAKDQVYLYPTAAKQLVTGLIQTSDETDGFESLEQLSAREREILVLIAKGFSNKEIADQLFISVKTVETHKRHIMEKLGLTKRHEIVNFALKRGLLDSYE